MRLDADPHQVAEDVLSALSKVVRRVRQIPVEGGLTLPERTALSRLDRGGPTTSADLARQVQISAQSMGATLAVLEDRGLVERRADPDDGRRQIISVTKSGRAVLQTKRNPQTERFAEALATDFSPTELRRLAAAAPLLERLAELL